MKFTTDRTQLLKGCDEKDEVIDDNYNEASPKRRRKVDDEGFVTPTTPDIPKTSPYYQYEVNKNAYAISSAESDQNFTPTYSYDAGGFSDFQVSERNEAYEDSPLSGANNQSLAASQALGEHSLTESEISQSFNDQSKTAPHLSQTSDIESFSKETKGYGTVDNDEELPSSSLNNYDDKNIADIIRDMNEKSSKVYMHWLELFCEGEKFEEDLPSFIDDLLNQAKRIEEDLIEQKESLRQRIHGITQTLRIDDL